jgi:antitoxin component of MazEF toxin-antitoxin module
MAMVQIKKVIKIGGSMAIILPCQWAKQKVKPRQEMVVIGDGELRIFPVHHKDGEVEHEAEGTPNH